MTYIVNYITYQINYIYYKFLHINSIKHNTALLYNWSTYDEVAVILPIKSIFLFLIFTFLLRYQKGV